MLLVFYPIEWGRHTFNTMTAIESARIFKTAIDKEEDVYVFNLSSASQQGKINNVSDLTEMMNNEDLYLEGLWSLSLDISEDEYCNLDLLSDKEWQKWETA